MELEIISPAPVLNTSDFSHAFGGDDGREIPRDALGHPLHYEFVALPGMFFHVEEKLSEFIWRIRSKDYPSDRLFIDSRFTQPANVQKKRKPFPSRNLLAKRMERLLGTKYVWGGNWSAGIPELLTYYPPQGSIDEQTQTLWMMKGVDCSGLLYEATNGQTPRNTSDLIYFGSPVPIEGKTPKQLLRRLLPMDMVVWPGHVWFVLNAAFSIESKSPFGVIQRPLMERLEETCRERCALDGWRSDLDPQSHFVIRRITKT